VNRWNACNIDEEMEWFTKWVKTWKVCNVGEEMKRFVKSVNIWKVCNMGEKIGVKRWKVCNMGGEMKAQEGDWRRKFVKEVVQQGVRERKLTRKRARMCTLGAELDHLVRTLDFMRSFFFDFLATIVVVVVVAAAAGERSSSVAV
jgi:hypothetical protein